MLRKFQVTHPAQCNNRNTTCSHPFPEQQSPGVSRSSGRRLRWLSTTHWGSRESPKATLLGQKARAFAQSGEEMTKESGALFFLCNNFFTRSNQMPEMSPSFCRKDSLCPVSTLLFGTYRAWGTGRKEGIQRLLLQAPSHPHPLFALQPIADQLQPSSLPTPALQRMPLNS